MKKLIFIIASIICINFDSLAQTNKLPDICTIFGAVKEVTNRNDADYRIYIEDSEAFASLIIFKQDNKLYADKAGFWFFTPHLSLADFTVYFEKNKSLADFSVYYTTTESFARCNN